MKKLIYLVPHLSTGGMPQYLLKQIESIQNDFDVYCIEWADVTGGKLVVQRNRIKKILNEKLITLGDDKFDLFKWIDKIKPDIIHLQEIPEIFAIPNKIATQLYQTDRKYTLIETSHDSSFNVINKLYFPDKFLMVSQYQINQYEKLDIPCELVEYPIEYKTRTNNRDELLSKLNLDPNKKHIINVGLFTPRKNQAEIIEYARMLEQYPIQFHFIGNQADNFKHYWEPLMKDFPSNCTWWDERDDVDTFFEVADLFLFTSKGTDNDKETMPLVIREAISWRTPSLIYNLPVYMNYFNQYNNIDYLDFDDQEKNTNKILKKLNMNETNMMETYKFWSDWNSDEQKMYYKSYYDVNFKVIVSLKEYQSNSVLWSSVYDKLHKDLTYWMIPVAKHVHNYQNDENFGGIKICIYKEENNELLYEHPYFFTFVKIPRITLSNSIPYHLNYVEFFIKNKYKKYFNRQYLNVVDAGANVGVFSEYLIKNQICENILAIECDSNALRDLKHNFIRDNRVEVIPKALNSVNDKVKFYQSEANPVISSLIPPDKLKNHLAGVKGDIEVEVESITVKDVVDKLGVVDLFKIDIEGGEYEVINSIDPSLFNNINNFLIECHFFEDDYLIKYNNLIKKLSDNGYEVEEYLENQSINMKGSSEVIFAHKK